MKNFLCLIIFLFSLGCNSSDQTPAGLKKYEDKNKTSEENLFYNQASFYLNMEYENSLFSERKEDSATIFQFMTGPDKHGSIAYKVTYKNGWNSVLYKKKNKKQFGYAFYFDEKNHLTNMGDYADWDKELVNQSIYFDEKGKIKENSRFIIYSPEFRTKSDTVINIYVYPFKEYKAFGTNMIISILSSKRDTLSLREYPAGINSVSFQISDKMIDYDTLILRVAQRWETPELKKEHLHQLFIIEKQIYLKTKNSIPEVQFPKNRILPH